MTKWSVLMRRQCLARTSPGSQLKASIRLIRDGRDHPLKLPPTLIIESLGPCHETHDQRVKRGWYQDFGVGHYWLVDAYKRELQCLVLDAGSYRVDASGSGDDARIAPPTFPGLTFELRDIWTSDS